MFNVAVCLNKLVQFITFFLSRVNIPNCLAHDLTDSVSVDLSVYTCISFLTTIQSSSILFFLLNSEEKKYISKLVIVVSFCINFVCIIESCLNYACVMIFITIGIQLVKKKRTKINLICKLFVLTWGQFYFFPSW